MKITIDTKEDSHEEIKKVISLLTTMMGDGVETNAPSAFEGEQAESPAFANMFGDSEPQEKEPEEKDDFPQMLEYS